MACLIYKIESTSDKIYVGSTCNFVQRKINHLHNLRKGKHHSKHLQNSFNKNGEASLQFIVIEDNIDLSLQVVREQYYIDLLKPVYNMTLIAGLPPNHTGKKRSKEFCENLSKFNKGKTLSEDHKKLISSNHGCKKITDEQVMFIRDLLSQNIKQIVIAKMVGTDQGTISRIKNNKRFNYVCMH